MTSPYGGCVSRLVVLSSVVLTLVACAGPRLAAPQTFTTGSTEHSRPFGGVDRSYRVYVPAGLPAAAPLVVMLHGGLGTAEQAERTYGWDQLADREKFVVAYPDGVGRAWNVHGGCCGTPGRQGIDDVGFITAVVDEVAANLPVDRNRLYVTGISNGGMMSYALACSSDVFAAIGPDSATQLDPCATPHPTSVLAIHGTADRNIRYEGGAGAGIAHIDGPPVPAVNAFWRNVDRCAAAAVSSRGVVTTAGADCADGRAVTLITIEGAGHQWPGSRPVREGADPPSDALNATATLWAFFAAHPRVT
jgi:polyhydroxybutyrate depolymerase